MTDHPPSVKEVQFLSSLVGCAVAVHCTTGQFYVGELLFIGQHSLAVQPEDAPQPVLLYRHAMVSIGRYTKPVVRNVSALMEELG